MFAARAALMTSSAGLVRSTSLSLLHFDNNVTDVGASAATWTRSGGSFSTTAKFGTHSLSLPGSNSLYSNQSFTAPSTFTAECWFKPTSLSQVCNIFGMQTNASGYAPFLVYQVNGAIQFNVGNGSLDGWAIVTSGGGSLFSQAAFAHVAVSSNGTTMEFFVNGTRVTSISTPSWSTSVPLYIGNDSAGSYPMNGLIDEFRFDSVRYYTGVNFTPPTAAFT